MHILRDLGVFLYLVPLQPEKGDYQSISDVPDYIGRAIPFFILFIALEYFYGLCRNYKLYSLKDSIMSLSLGIVQQLLGIWMKEALILPYLLVYALFAPIRERVLQSGYWPDMSGDQYTVLTFVVGFLGCDLGYYFLHRTAHEWQLLWSAHSVHHSGERYNLATALRQGAFQSAYSWFFYIPLAAMGLPVTHFIRHNRLNTIYQFWIHTEVVGRCPWLIELVMNTASHHRLHHRPPGNCNYAGVLIIWDRLFCTFQSERHLTTTRVLTTGKDKQVESCTETPRGVIYGLARPLNNYDPVYANLCHLLRLCEVNGSRDSSNAAESSVFFARLRRFFTVVVTKRIKQSLGVTLSVDELMPDVLEDWRIAEKCIAEISTQEGYPYPIAYAVHVWREMWALPPPLDETALAKNRDGDESIDPREVGRGKSEFSHRDMVFLIGRQKREAPTLSSGLSLIVSAQFLLALIVGYSVLTQPNNEHSVSTLSATSTDSSSTNISTSTVGTTYAADSLSSVLGNGGDHSKICNAMVCIGCVLLLQTIKFYYEK